MNKVVGKPHRTEENGERVGTIIRRR